MPRASIIITTHNRPQLLPVAVQSALSSGTDVEVVVVDDASSDETAQICQALPGINYVRVERNQGVAGARNVGLVASRGEYVSFLDDDDTRLPGSLDRQIEILEKNPPAGLIYGQAILEDQNHRSKQHPYPSDCPQGDVFWKLLSRNFIPCGSTIFRRSCLSRVGLLDSAIPGLDDWDLWIRIAETYPIIAVETPVIIWRRSTPASEQGTSQSAQIVSFGVQQFRQYWMELPRAAAASNKIRRAAWRDFSENMVEHLIWESLRAVRHGRLNQALRNILTVPQLNTLALMGVVKKRLLRVQSTNLRDSLGRSSHADAALNRANSKL